MKVTKNVLISFVGLNDEGKLKGKDDGAILTVFKAKLKFDEVHLLWTQTRKSNVNFYDIACYVKEELLKRKYCRKVNLHLFVCDDVTDHNEIYPKLIEFCKSLNKDKNEVFTAAIASGTPAMMVCWILMAESGDFPLKLIRSNEPRFNKKLVTEIKLGTGLPRIVHLEEENKELRKINRQLLPSVKMNIKKGTVYIGDTEINLSPIQFAYYRYFLERAKEVKEFERFSGINTPGEFLRKIIKYHEETYPEADLFRYSLVKMLKDNTGYDIRTFRGNLTKLNIKIRECLDNDVICNYFNIRNIGKRHRKCYGINILPEKIIFE